MTNPGSEPGTDASGTDASGPAWMPAGLARYLLALEAGRMGTWYWDVATNRLHWDEQLERVFGLDPGTFGETFDDYLAVLHPDDVDHTVATIQDSMTGDRGHYVEHRVRMRDGTVRWINGTGRVVRGDDGEVIAMVGVGADITEQRTLAEAKAAAETERNAALAEAARSQASLVLLGRVSGVLGASLDVDTTLQQIADLLVQEHLGDWCVVQLRDNPAEGSGVAQVALAHRDPAMVSIALDLQREYPPDPLNEEQGLGKVIKTGQPEFWPTVPSELLAAAARDERHLELLQGLQLSAAIIVPLKARGRVLGGLTLIGTHGRSFDEQDLQTAVLVGLRAGMALDNANLFAERDLVARTLQRSLLPPMLPSVPGLDLAAHYRPGTTQHGIGGDFYDVFPVGPNSWRVVIGDVCGKGVEAAALTGAVRYALRTAAVFTASPAEVLRVVNDALLLEEWHGRFATLTLVQVQFGPDGAHMTVASGGHPPPLLRHADGSVEALDSHGSLLGALSEVDFTEVSRPLVTGDCLLLYTDGATEAGVPPDLFGEERLRQVFGTTQVAAASGIVKVVVEAIEDFTRELAGASEDHQDDLALVAVRVS